jgi:hypothetical protein
VLIDLLDLAQELVEPILPLSFVLLREDISVLVLELLDLLLDFLDLVINLSSITCDSLEIRTENSIELLNDDTCLLEVT